MQACPQTDRHTHRLTRQTDRQTNRQTALPDRLQCRQAGLQHWSRWQPRLWGSLGPGPAPAGTAPGQPPLPAAGAAAPAYPLWQLPPLQSILGRYARCLDNMSTYTMTRGCIGARQHQQGQHQHFTPFSSGCFCSPPLAPPLPCSSGAGRSRCDKVWHDVYES